MQSTKVGALTFGLSNLRLFVVPVVGQGLFEGTVHDGNVLVQVVELGLGQQDAGSEPLNVAGVLGHLGVEAVALGVELAKLGLLSLVVLLYVSGNLQNTEVVTGVG